MRNIPEGLQESLDEDCTTLCTLLKLTRPDGFILGLTSLDRVIVYDDGTGETTYYPDPGFQPADIEASNDLSVDNTEGLVLLPLSSMPMNPADIRRGLWDDSRLKVMRINYEAPGQGHYEMLSGVIGDITIRNDLTLVLQLDGNARPLRQTMCWRDSITCRAVFGSQEADEVEFCGKDVSSLWVPFTVTSVEESDRAFTASALGQPTGYFVPGGVLWDTGANAGYFHSIDSFDAGGTIGLRVPLRFSAQVGDKGRIRIDCTKYIEGAKGCREHHGDDWVNHLRAEPHIPMGGDAQTPGAQVGPGAGGSTTIPETEDA